MARIKDFWLKIKTKIQHTPWLTLQLFLTILVLVIFLGLIIWNEPISKMMAPATASLTPNMTPTGLATETPSWIPAEYRQNTQQPNINILGASLMILIVFVGTLTHLSYRKKGNR
jgi:Fe2+ transport system protein B